MLSIEGIDKVAQTPAGKAESEQWKLLLNERSDAVTREGAGENKGLPTEVSSDEEGHRATNPA